MRWNQPSKPARRPAFATGWRFPCASRPASRLQLLHLPVETNAAPSARDDARARLGYSADDLVILAIGRSAPVKGWDVLLRAFTAVHNVNPRVRLLLVGGIDNPDERALYSELQRLVDETRLRPVVRF